MRACIIAAAVSATLSFPGQAQRSVPADSLLDHLVGRWVMRGTIGKQQTTHDLTMRWVLDSEYVEMHEVSRDKAASGKPAYEAIVWFVKDPHTGEYAAQWFDNTDYTAFKPAGVGHGTRTGDAITFLFTTSPTDRDHTTFAYDRKSDSWTLTIDGEVNGILTPFARTTITRK
jgi:hypothetical protein